MLRIHSLGSTSVSRVQVPKGIPEAVQVYTWAASYFGRVMQQIREFFGSIVLVPVFIGIWIWDRITGKPPADFS